MRGLPGGLPAGLAHAGPARRAGATCRSASTPTCSRWCSTSGTTASSTACPARKPRCWCDGGRADSSRQIYLESADNGPGICPDLFDKIFEPFFTTSAQGTGLGLYLAREICDMQSTRLIQVPQGQVRVSASISGGAAKG